MSEQKEEQEKKQEQEQEQEQEVVEKKPLASVKEELKRILTIVAVVVVFVVVFRQVMPLLFFAMNQDETTEKTNIPAIEQAEKSVVKENIKDVIKAPIETPSELVVSPEPAIISPEPAIISESSSDNEKNLQSPEGKQSLEEKILSLESSHKMAISELKSKFEAQVSAAKSKSDNMFLALVAFSELKEAVKNGEPYSDQLNKLKKFTENNEQSIEIINMLLQHSKTGVTTPTKLAKEFNQFAKDALISNNSSWFKNILHRFITIRKIGKRVGEDDESVLARAEINLTQYDVKLALKELEQLSPPAKEVFDKWTAQANDWLEMQENISKLQLLLTNTKAFKTEFMFQL